MGRIFLWVVQRDATARGIICIYCPAPSFQTRRDMDEANVITTRLLTLLNVSATKIGKRKRPYEDDNPPQEKLNKRKSIQFQDSEPVSSHAPEAQASEDHMGGDKQETEQAEAEAPEEETEGGLRAPCANK